MKIDIDAMKKIVDVCVRKDKFSYEMYLNAPRPSGKFCAIRFKQSKTLGYDDVYHEDVDDDYLKVTSQGIRVITYDCLFTRDDIEVLEFDNSFLRQDVKDVMYKYGHQLIHKFPTKLENNVLETTWEIRTGITVTMNVLRTQVSVVNRLTQAPVKSYFVDAHGDVLNFD